MNANTVFQLSLFFLPDIILLAYLIILLILKENVCSGIFQNSLPALIVFVVLKMIGVILVSKHYLFGRIGSISEIINEFKKGRFTINRKEIRGKDELAHVFNDLTIIGKHFEDIVSSQKSEVEQLREMYNNIVLSMSSYFLVLNENEEIIFANDSFCHKFQYDQSELNGSNIDDVFIFLTGRIKEAIASLKNTGESYVLEKSHLLSKNRISVIADIKISRIVVQGKNQIILVIDDITSKCKKDYQITLISQISESIQRDAEIDKVLYTILTGVTSGSGLGFNRAMLFLLDEKERALVGKMAVGPDSMEEAIEIWSSIPTGRVDILNKLKKFDTAIPKGKRLLEKVLNARFPYGIKNIFYQSIEEIENIHVYDSSRDERVDPSIREFMDASEFVIVPLIAVNKSIGIIVADNKFNHTPIGNDSIELLSIFAFQSALSIESYNNLSMLKKEMQKVTDRQEAIVESEKLAAIGRIAAHIAHEIRNPLVTMGGYARRVLQLSRDAAKNESIIKSASAVILKESERLEKVLSNVMDFTRPAPYIQEFNNINEIIEDTIDLLKNVFQERKIKIYLDLKKDMPLIKSDFNQLKQAMLNLLQNAIDATPPDGSVSIITTVNEKNVEISIQDSGAGIKDDDINRIFEPFFTTKVTGVGLGLAIVKKIIKDHGGEITVENRLKGGTEFKITMNLP